MQNVVDNPQARRYELVVDGQLAIAQYRLDGDRLSINHVEVPESLRGQGVAARLMDGVVGDAQARGLTIVPVCPYAAAYLKRRQEA
jgi:predicted GNAT family acetyltransferase